MADSPLGLGNILGAGAGLGALAYTMGKGESPLPSQYDVVQNTYAPTEFGQGQALYGQGQALAAQGQSLLAKAGRGELTAPQQASLSQTRTGLENQAAQMYYNMGRSPTHDTSFIGTTADIDARVNAMAQQFIQTTIQLGASELSAGSSFMTAGTAEENAATGAMLQVGQAQLKNDEDYSNAVSAAFGALAKGFGGGGTTIKMG